MGDRTGGGGLVIGRGGAAQGRIAGVSTLTAAQRAAEPADRRTSTIRGGSVRVIQQGNRLMPVVDLATTAGTLRTSIAGANQLARNMVRGQTASRLIGTDQAGRSVSVDVAPRTAAQRRSLITTLRAANRAIAAVNQALAANQIIGPIAFGVGGRPRRRNA